MSHSGNYDCMSKFFRDSIAFHRLNSNIYLAVIFVFNSLNLCLGVQVAVPHDFLTFAWLQGPSYLCRSVQSICPFQLIMSLLPLWASSSSVIYSYMHYCMTSCSSTLLTLCSIIVSSYFNFSAAIATHPARKMTLKRVKNLSRSMTSTSTDADGPEDDSINQIPFEDSGCFKGGTLTLMQLRTLELP
jgi:hypothetical protein